MIRLYRLLLLDICIYIKPYRYDEPVAFLCLYCIWDFKHIDATFQSIRKGEVIEEDQSSSARSSKKAHKDKNSRLLGIAK